MIVGIVFVQKELAKDYLSARRQVGRRLQEEPWKAHRCG